MSLFEAEVRLEVLPVPKDVSDVLEEMMGSGELSDSVSSATSRTTENASIHAVSPAAPLFSNPNQR